MATEKIESKTTDIAGQVLNVAGLVEYREGSIVSREIVKRTPAR